MFCILDDDANKELEVTAIHDDSGYRAVREQLSNQYNLSMNEPNIQVFNVDMRGDRSLTLRHYQHNRRPLDKPTGEEVLKHLHRLWKFDVNLESLNGDKVTQKIHCPTNSDKASKENKRR